MYTSARYVLLVVGTVIQTEYEVAGYTGPGNIVPIRILTQETELRTFW
jgi:hypothetical protein